MSNMSYCKFENTRSDLKDCIHTLENRNISSERERRHVIGMLKEILDFCINESIIENFDFDKINEVVTECKEQNDE